MDCRVDRPGENWTTLNVRLQQNTTKEGALLMKRIRFSVEQAVGVLRLARVGVPVVELIRKVGISEQTFYRW